MMQRLLYDAKFSGPRGDLNPMGLKVPGLISVQLFPVRSDKWIIKNPDTNGSLSRHDFPSPDQAMAFLPKLFEKQCQEWTIRHMDGTPYTVKEG